MIRNVIVIGGPTASGKSGYALDIASRELLSPARIINADSLQLYADLPVLTAHPAAEDMRTTHHSLYGVLPGDTPSSAGKWRDMAANEIHHAFAAGEVPVVVGGTGLYLKTLIEGLSPIPQVPPEIRADANALQAGLGNPAFHAHLSAHDPEMGARIDPMHTSRLIRAWEVLQATGKSLAYWQALPKEGPPEDWYFDIRLILPDREALSSRCETRFHEMIEDGALDEVRALDARIRDGDIAPDAPVTKALGFQALQAHLHGRLSLDEAIEQAGTATRQYAKRQVTWFRNQIKGGRTIT